ncbi:MAG: dimethylarginine dimethylaminohydrolase family protein [Bacteroidia bacterium]
MIPVQTFQRLSDFQADFNVKQFEKRVEPQKVLMCSPDYFDIIDVKNPYMESQEGLLNHDLAYTQWEQLKAVYENWKTRGLIEEVFIIPGAEGREDMVFCANQSFPYLNALQQKAVVMSKMRHESRQLEVPHFERFYKDLGYQITHLQEASLFEGMGDTIPHPGRKLFYGGYGHRSDSIAYAELMKITGASFVLLELVNENFYHLDTCFVPLSDEAVMYCPEAFTPEGIQIIQRCFTTIYEIPMDEVLSTFCLNAHVLTTEKQAVLQSGSVIAKAALLKESYEIAELETSEFMKSGGSVFCMKMMVY